MVKYNGAGHFFASVFHDFVVASRAVAQFSNKVQPEAPTIEVITSLVPVYGPEAAMIERLAFAALGEFAAMVQASGGAAKAATLFPQVDPTLLAEVEDKLQKNPQLVEQAAKMLKINA